MTNPLFLKCIHANLGVRLGARNRDKVVKDQEPLPNHLIKQQQEDI